MAFCIAAVFTRHVTLNTSQSINTPGHTNTPDTEVTRGVSVPRLVTGTGEAPSVAGGCAIYYVTYCALLLVSTIHNTEKASSSGAADPAPARPKLHRTHHRPGSTLYAELKRVICRGGAICGHTSLGISTHLITQHAKNFGVTRA